MALVVATLQNQLIQVFGSSSDNAIQKAQQISNIYQSYASTAMAGVLLPTFLGTEAQQFLSKILPSFTNKNGNKSQFSLSLANAVEAFWLFPPVLFAGPSVAGAVTSFPGKSALISSLNGIFATTYDKHQRVAVSIANALDTATKTITVTYAPPPGSTAVLA
jgi:hypothetical protein